MHMIKGCLALALASGLSATAQAQEGIVKLPDQIEWKAPAVSPGPSTAVLYGDPSKPAVYVARTKLPAGFKFMPHTHPDEWRTVVVLSGTLYFGLFDWPNLPLFTGLPRAQLRPMHETWETVHVVLAWSAIVLVPLHVGAALYHHFWRGDPVLRRMLPGTTIEGRT